MARSHREPLPGGKDMKHQGIPKSRAKPYSYGRRTTKSSKTKETSTAASVTDTGVHMADFKQENSDRTSPLLSLPAELRNNVYEKVFENQAKVYLLKRTRGKLVSQNALARVSRQVRNEFASVMNFFADEIIARVENFDFRHIVTFLNRLSDKEMMALEGSTSARKLRIELTFTSSFRCNRTSEEFALLRRWINRLEHPTKRGTKIDALYEVVESNGIADYIILEREVGISGQDRPDRQSNEVRKIQKAIRDWTYDTLEHQILAEATRKLLHRAILEWEYLDET